jgi:hypothetical protein
MVRKLPPDAGSVRLKVESDLKIAKHPLSTSAKIQVECAAALFLKPLEARAKYRQNAALFARALRQTH